MRIALLWDASGLWGLLAWRAFAAMGLPCCLVKGQDIAQALCADKPCQCPALLVVPGGTASLKYAALGPGGRAAVTAYVRGGGQYLGLCGGAGLALADPDAGLALCPWRRAAFADRLQHFLSGHVRARFGAAHPLLPPGDAPGDANGTAESPAGAALPVWWPGRFAEPDGPEHGAGRQVAVLARYAGPEPDLHVADFALAGLPEAVRAEWAAQYGISLTPEAFAGAPCVIHGAYGLGSYTLSYSHLETPASPEANAWLAHLVERLGGGVAATRVVPEWEADPALRPADPDLRACLADMAGVLELGLEHGLLFARTPWLAGWRSGVPGAALNTLALMLRTLAEHEGAEHEGAEQERLGRGFAERFALFCGQARSLLLAQRLAATVPDAVPRDRLTARREALFGSAMRAGGLYQELAQELDERLFAVLRRATCTPEGT